MAYSITADATRPEFWASRPSTVLQRMADEDPAFLPLTIAPFDPARPLLVLVHPGDMVETAEGWRKPEYAKAAVTFWQHNAQGLSRELADARKQGHDIVVLHRSSSMEFSDTIRRHSSARQLWRKHLCPLFSSATALWGDDLDAVLEWLMGHAHPLGRPGIHLAGAYACPDHGCLTAIGRGLLSGGVSPHTLTVSPFSPPGNGPGPVWRPQGVEEMHVPAEIAELYAAE